MNKRDKGVPAGQPSQPLWGSPPGGPQAPPPWAGPPQRPAALPVDAPPAQPVPPPPPPPSRRLRRLKPRKHQDPPGSDVPRYMEKKQTAPRTRIIILAVAIAGVALFAFIGGLTGEKKATTTTATKQKTDREINAIISEVSKTLYVIIDFPAPGEKVGNNPVTVAGEVRDSYGIVVGGAEVVVSIDAEEKARCVTLEDGRFSAPVLLDEPGTNLITVSVVKGTMKGSASVSCYYPNEPAGI